jgi:hypothetical protein
MAHNTLDELESLHQTGIVHEYWHHFERWRSHILLEGTRFSDKDFIDSFISGLKGEIKSFVLAFKHESLDAALEYALYIENATDI